VKNVKNTNDRRHLSSKKGPDPSSHVSVDAAVEEDCQLGVKALATVHWKSISTIHAILHEDLGLENKSARLVSKFFSDDQKQQRVEICTEFVAAIHHHLPPFSHHTELYRHFG
jgi:hypothetical protein